MQRVNISITVFFGSFQVNFLIAPTSVIFKFVQTEGGIPCPLAEYSREIFTTTLEALATSTMIVASSSTDILLMFDGI